MKLYFIAVLISKQSYRVQRSLTNIERQYQIRQRWTTTSCDFRSFRQASKKINQSVMLQKISNKAQERFFLLDVKAKYASKNDMMCGYYYCHCQCLFF